MSNDTEIFAKLSANLWMNEKFGKFASANPRAAIVWIKAITFAANRKNDGFIGEYTARHLLGATPKDLRLLVENSFFEPKENGWIIHDYLDSQFSSKEIDEMTKRRKEAARKAGLASAQARAEKKALEPVATDVQRTVDETLNDSLNENPTDVQRQSNDSSTKNQPDIDIDIDSNLLITPPTPSKPDLAGLLDSLERLYPTNRFDGKTSQARMQLEIEWPKIVRAAGKTDPREFLEAKTRAYVGATEERFVKTFSRFIGGELYARNWEKPKPETPSPRQVQPVKSRSQQNLEANMAKTWQYMTEEERARYSQGGFNAQQG